VIRYRFDVRQKWSMSEMSLATEATPVNIRICQQRTFGAGGRT